MLKNLIAEHVIETQSRFAERLLHGWDSERGNFWQIIPKEMLDKLAQPVKREEAAEAGKRA